ncbi:centrosomal protein of 19 kDa-like isoform X1 [Varroa destructor]|uniref:Centrosomal protein of 19 kDa n=2 Tax=Varroa destructor TaxID=109461 RepID=A0A7M7M4V9_VARDE|nr:centrosomal protein of 19 kDa-like isoform X1 [Varroa destructor]
MADKSKTEKNKVKKVGLILTGTPKLVVVYEKDEQELTSSPKRRYRKRTMPIRGLYRNSDLKLISAELCKRHAILGHLAILQMEKLLAIVQETRNGASVADSIRTATQRYTLDPDEDLNVLDDKTLQVKKQLMAESFEQAALKPGDPGFTYNIEVDFNTFETSADWDNDSDEVVDF